MYLAPERVGELLQELAGASAPGSVLVTMSVIEEVVADIQVQGTKSELMGSWKFGCPRDPAGWLAAGGWRLALATTRAKMARALGLAPEVCAFEADSASDRDGRSLFMVATLA
jgi:O-methyltransferase involved in polyketide biosynthesis